MKLTYKWHSLLWVPIFVCITMSCSQDSEELNTEINQAFIENQVTIPESKPIEAEILSLINNHRIEIGLKTLDTSLDIIKSQTSSHTNYMIDHKKVSHDNFINREVFLESFTGAVSVAENVAYGYSDAETLVNAWLNSPGHRRNIEGNFTHFQITGKKDENGIWYYTNIFVRIQ